MTLHTVSPARPLTRSNEGILVRADGPDAREEAAPAVDRFEIVSGLLRDGLWDWDVSTGRVEYTPRWLETLGVDASSFPPTLDAWVQLVHPSDRLAFSAAFEAVAAGEARALRHQHRVRHADGHFRIVEAAAEAVVDRAGRTRRVVGVLTDVTRQRLLERKLLFDTYHDPLTGLPNRTYFGAIVEQAVERAKGDPTYQFAVVVVDVDRFHLINDGLGHATGNRLLLAAADRLRACLRPDDTLARLAADEFAILLDYIDSLAEAKMIADRVQGAFAHVFDIDGHHVFASISAGIAWSGGGPLAADSLLPNAIAAANHAKAQGRARWEVFHPTMLHDRRDALRRESDLRRGIERGEFALRYQPIVAVETGRLVGFEALVRWRHPALGEIEPSEFIPMAEETGLIVPLGQWILAEAWRQARAWREMFPDQDPLAVSVNLSPRQLADADLLAWIQAIRKEEDLNPGSLRLEITESIMMDDVASTSALVAQLRELGFGVHIDDFGTGYSSLSTLPVYSVDSLKIDRSFVAGMIESPRMQQVVRTIIGLAQTLGLDTTAEGVETREQLEKLREFRCTHAQGFYFASPLTRPQAEDLIRAKPQWG